MPQVLLECCYITFNSENCGINNKQHEAMQYHINITSRSFVIARLSGSNKTTAQISTVQYLVSACVIS